jgi:hypothetical protein
MGAIRPAFAASTAPLSELSSQGCATAVGVGGKALQRSMSRSYLSCFFSMTQTFHAVVVIKNRRSPAAILAAA